MNAGDFRGRTGDLALLRAQLDDVVAGRGATRGRAVTVTGRRRVGKSRLVQEFCDRSGVPHLIFQATRGRRAEAERADFTDALSDLPGGDLVAGLPTGDWNQSLRALALSLPEDRPSVVVLDEVPWLVEQDPVFEGALQTVWDRYLSARPVLLLLVGSDLAVMEALQTHGRPFYGRAARMIVRPLHLADVRDLTGTAAPDAVDAWLITGGFPEIVRSWPAGASRSEFLRAAVGNPLSPLLVAGELSLLGEFPGTGRARAVLETVGSGERTFSAIAADAGGSAPLASGTLAPLLTTLVDKRVLAADLPLSTTSDTRNRRYRIADPYLRFWLAFLRRGLPLIERGRPDLALAEIERGWTSWRGRAVEPLVRESVLRLLPDLGWPDTAAVGGWWNRQKNPEIDIVAADRAPTARAVHLAGSVKWLEGRPFGRADHDALARDVTRLPGATPDLPLMAVSRSGVEPGLPLAVVLSPDDLVRAWRTG